MPRYYKINRFACANTAVYVRIDTPEQAARIEAVFEDLANQGEGYAGWTSDKVAPIMAIPYDDYILSRGLEA